MVCLGVVFSSFSSAVPLFAARDAGCQLMVYLYGFGFLMVTAALSTKMFAMERVLDNALQMRQTSSRSVQTAAKMMCAFAFGELVILASWSLSDSPLAYSRECISKQNGGPHDGECLESVGKCSSDHAGTFVSLLALYHVACLLAGMGMCYHVRNLPSILSEGKWVFTAFYSQLQAVVIAVPVLVMIKDEYEMFTFLKSLVICASDLTTLIMVFIPKMNMITKYHDFDKEKVSCYIRDTMKVGTQDDSVYELLRKDKRVDKETGASFFSTTTMNDIESTNNSPRKGQEEKNRKLSVAAPLSTGGDATVHPSAGST